MKLRHVINLVVAIAILACLAFAFFRPREPRYRDKTLSEWIFDAENLNELDPDRHAALEAVKHLAPTAIPWLLNWAHMKDSPLKSSAIAFLQDHPRLHLQIRPSSYYHNEAVEGFGILKEKARPAWPALVQLTSSRDFETRLCALDALAAVVPDRETFLPVLLRMARDPDEHVQTRAKIILSDYYPKDAKAAGAYVNLDGVAAQNR